MQMRSELISIVKLETYTSPCGLIFKLVGTKHGLRITDCGLGIKHALGVKYGLRTEYKTWTRYEMRTTDYVYKNSFRKVKLRETESSLAKTVVPALTFL